MTRHERKRYLERNVRRLTKTLSRMSSDEIAAALSKRGIRGLSGVSHSCPIAVYFERTLQPRNVSIYTTTLYVGTPLGCIHTEHDFTSFLTRVDTNDYPELVL